VLLAFPLAKDCSQLLAWTFVLMDPSVGGRLLVDTRKMMDQRITMLSAVEGRLDVVKSQQSASLRCHGSGLSIHRPMSLYCLLTSTRAEEQVHVERLSIRSRSRDYRRMSPGVRPNGSDPAAVGH